MAGRRGRFGATVMALTGLAGCASVPDLPANARLTASDVTALIQCQLRTALLQATSDGDADWMKNWGVGVSLIIERRIIQSASGSLNWTIPTLPTQGLSVVAPNAQIRGTRYRKAEVDFTFRSSRLIDPPAGVAEDLERLCSPEERAKRGQAVFHGDIGIGEWIAQVIGAANIRGSVQRPKGFGHRVEFALTSSGGIGPQFRIINLSGSATVSAEINEIYSLAIAFTYIDPKDPAFAPVWVVNSPHQQVVMPPLRDGTPSRPVTTPGHQATPAASAVPSSTRRRTPRVRSVLPDQLELPAVIQDRLDFQLRSLQSGPSRYLFER